MVIDIENNLWGYGSNKHGRIGFLKEHSEELLQVNTKQKELHVVEVIL